MAGSPLLRMEGVSQTFGPVKALDGIDFNVYPGEVHALLGENGAGKSTLIKTMTGAAPLSSGRILLHGQEIRPRSPHHAQELGISCVYQEVNLLPNLSVAENLTLGRTRSRRGLIDWRAARASASAALASLEVSVDVSMPLGACSIAIQQLVAIARAVAIKAEVLVLDEPTSSLDEAEVQKLFTVLRKLRGEGIGIVFITHFLDQVDAISDRITILRNGRLVGEHLPAELTRGGLVAKMVGKELGGFSESRSVAASSSGPSVLEASGIKRGNVGPLDVQIPAGHVVGLAGLLGSGRTETARLIFGLDRLGGGSVRFKGSAISRFSPKASLRRGIGFLPEDRKREGIIPNMSIRENIALALQAKQGGWRRVPRKLQEEMAERFRLALRIAMDSAERPINTLSGGNQQKAILARWLATEPALLILDEPTRGIDVGAREEIETLIGKLCQDGVAVLMISSEIDELLRCCDRLVVLFEGRFVAELPGGTPLDEVMKAMGGTA